MKKHVRRTDRRNQALRIAWLALLLFSCSNIAIATAPRKQAVRDDSAGVQAAEATFWSTLHEGRYDEIEPALDQLEAALLAHPAEPRTAAHIAFLHIWRISERARAARIEPTVVDDMLLARRYFEEAVKLDPSDARFAGFLAGSTMAEGTILHDEKLVRTGFFAMKDAVAAWPEFNLFTRGYTMSSRPYDDRRFADGLEDQWETLDLCIEGKIDRANPDYGRFMSMETREGPKRACWNSTIAPHNFEGFFLNMGDMLVKSGDVASARKIYAQAKQTADYASWPYRAVLEQRIVQAEENVPLFRAAPVPEGGVPSDRDRRPMIETRFACMACHQTGG